MRAAAWRLLTFLFSPPVTHYSMWLLVSWAHCSSTVKSSLADSDRLHDWLKKLTLLVPEVSRPRPAAPAPGREGRSHTSPATQSGFRAGRLLSCCLTRRRLFVSSRR